MFGTMLYYNKQKVQEYLEIVSKKKTIQPSKVTVESDKNVGLNVGVVDLGAKGRTSIEGEYRENAMLDCLNLESQLKGRDDYFDFVEGDVPYTLSTVPASSIIKIRGVLEIPDGVDLINLAEQFWPQIIGSIECKDAQERELLNTVLGKSKTKIPMLVEIGEQEEYKLLFSKLRFTDFLIDVDELEEYENSEVTILGRVLCKKELHDSTYVAYDIYRDFLGLNRALRKEIKADDGAPFKNIELEESFVELDIIGMYY